MKSNFFSLVLFLISSIGLSQIKNTYSISFSNAHHHEAQIAARFTNLESGPVIFSMSKSLPQSIESHLFSKNIIQLKATNGKGDQLKIQQKNLSEWVIDNHNGTINISYTLFANKGDGIHSIIDENLALLNAHSTYIYVDKLKSRPVEVELKNFESYQWQIATQLKKEKNHVYRASNLDNLLDSPILLSAHKTKEFRADVYGTEYTFELNFFEANAIDDRLFNHVISNLTKAIEQQKQIFGSYPNFDNNKYAFIIAIAPQLTTDHKPHKNSSVITNSSSGNVAKEIIEALVNNFIGSWLQKRIVPSSQEPYKHNQINMTEELWFSDGFTNYYTHLILLRSGLISMQEYLSELANVYNRTWISSALTSKNALTLSKLVALTHQAQANKNLYISHADYGYMLALALDLSLRNKDENLSLDNFMQLFWTKYGKTDTPFNIDNIFVTLREYAESSFADNFFEKYVFKTEQPDYKKLFESAGIDLINYSTPYTGIDLAFTKNRLAIMSNYPVKKSPAYLASLEKGDIILSIDNETFSDEAQFNLVLSTYKTGKKVTVTYKRFGVNKTTELELDDNPNINLELDEDPSKKSLELRDKWLNEK